MVGEVVSGSAHSSHFSARVLLRFGGVWLALSARKRDSVICILCGRECASRAPASTIHSEQRADDVRVRDDAGGPPRGRGAGERPPRGGPPHFFAREACPLANSPGPARGLRVFPGCWGASLGTAPIAWCAEASRPNARGLGCWPHDERFARSWRRAARKNVRRLPDRQQP